MRLFVDRLGIVAIKYLEPYWKETEDLLNILEYSIVLVDRAGTGSMARAYNQGFRELMKQGSFQYVWFVSNVTFPLNAVNKLLEQMDKTGFAAIHGSFKSGHPFCCPLHIEETRECPFIEFTAPIVRADVFEKIQLDEEMPYWGHDLDWGHRVRQLGWKIGVYHGFEFGHTYIQDNKNNHPVTKQRALLRRNTDGPTVRALQKKYGKDWRKKVWKI